ncbi:hypothetical protein E2C01_082897 [Portunus trituberculatus]|uniref:Uncharacterized protein n=1 Tax=Portunus trituberculatus TaxID=210409 RepID=A0A5B7J500_PORTR|nr:hypothetical protein [Portunus trituberculatus]
MASFSGTGNRLSQISRPESGHSRKTTPATDMLIRCDIIKTGSETALKGHEVELRNHVLS